MSLLLPIKHIEITSLSHDGRGVGFADTQSGRKPIFVNDALPGQTVDALIRQEKKSYCTGILQAVTASSFAPAKPICSHADICGGCVLQRLPYDRQLFWKQEIAFNALTRIGKIAPQNLACAWPGMRPSPQLTQFRNKAEFAFGYDQTGNLALGLRKRESHEVFNVTDCCLLEPFAMTILSLSREFAQNNGTQHSVKPGFWRFLTIRRGLLENRKAWWVICLTDKAGRRERQMVARLGEKLQAVSEEPLTFIHEERHKKDLLPIGQKRLLSIGPGQNQGCPITHNLLGRPFILDCASFFQVNTQASQSLAACALECDKPGDKLLDVYCGVGAPGLLLAETHEEITGIEQDSKAIEFAKINGQGQWHCGDAAQALKHIVGARSRYSTALLDPPRAGVERSALESVLALGPERIIYISCNPATLARDAQIIKKSYNLARLYGVDLFPHTAHVECCALWEKAPSKKPAKADFLVGDRYSRYCT